MAEKEYIERKAALRAVDGFPIMSGTARLMIECIPAADVVPQPLFEQIKWERNIAMEQLADHNIPFGGKADVTAVVRCAQCRSYEEPWCMLCKTRIGAGYHSRDMAYRRPDDFCSYGKRKEVL